MGMSTCRSTTSLTSPILSQRNQRFKEHMIEMKKREGSVESRNGKKDLYKTVEPITEPDFMSP